MEGSGSARVNNNVAAIDNDSNKAGTRSEDGRDELDEVLQGTKAGTLEC